MLRQILIASALLFAATPARSQQDDPITAAIGQMLEQGAAGLTLTQGDFSAIRRQGNTFLIPAWLRRKAILAAPTLGNQGTISRARSGKEIVGFRIESIARGSVLPHLGLLSGDIIRRVNGTALVSEEQALDLATQLSTASEIRLELERGKARQPMKLTYRVGS